MGTSDHRHRVQPDAKTLRRRRLAGLAMVVAMVALVVAVVSFVDGGPKSGPTTRAARRRVHHHSAAGKPVTTDGTFNGPDGVEANWVIAENKKPGTTAWKITTPQTADGIMGYADTQQATVGQKVTLYVSTQAPSFRVEAFRMGYYQGKGGHLIWTSKTVPGVVQPACPVIPTVFEVQCSWPASLTFSVTDAWVQGDYLLKLIGSGGQQSYVPLTIWDPSSDATYVVMNAVATWQVFNSFGGYDLYTGGPPGLKGYPDPDRSRIVSFDRPYAYGNGAASFITNELPLIEFMEEHGLNVTYWTDVTLATNGAQLVDHKALLSLGHDEEWSLRMRDNATTARDKGVNLMFFGASPVLRKIRFEASPIGPNMEVVNYRDPQADPLYGKDNAEVTQNWWGQPPANDPASTLVGSTYIGFNNTMHANMVVVDASSWVFKGTKLTNGSQIPNVLFTDFDGYDTSRPNPPDVQILTHSPVTIGFDGAKMYADTTYYTWPASKAGVFESGTNYWIAAMTACPPGTVSCAAPTLDTITGNLLAAFGAGPAGIDHPSVTNWQQFYPTAS